MAKLRLEKLVAIQKLPDDGLAADEVTVSLHPHAALRLPLSTPDCFPDACIKRRVIFLDKLIQLRLAGHKRKLGISFHELKHRGESARRFMARLFYIPQPGDINMAVADACRNRFRLAALQRRIERFPEESARLFHRIQKCRSIRGAQVQQIDRRR